MGGVGVRYRYRVEGLGVRCRYRGEGVGVQCRYRWGDRWGHDCAQARDALASLPTYVHISVHTSRRTSVSRFTPPSTPPLHTSRQGVDLDSLASLCAGAPVSPLRRWPRPVELRTLLASAGARHVLHGCSFEVSSHPRHILSHAPPTLLPTSSTRLLPPQVMRTGGSVWLSVTPPISASPSLRTVLIRAPTDGLANEYTRAAERALRTIRVWLGEPIPEGATRSAGTTACRPTEGARRSTEFSGHVAADRPHNLPLNREPQAGEQSSAPPGGGSEGGRECWIECGRESGSDGRGAAVVGRRVAIAGLARATEYNGRVGVVLGLRLRGTESQIRRQHWRETTRRAGSQWAVCGRFSARAWLSDCARRASRRLGRRAPPLRRGGGEPRYRREPRYPREPLYRRGGRDRVRRAWYRRGGRDRMRRAW